jgi:hypothetical protein
VKKYPLEVQFISFSIYFVSKQDVLCEGVSAMLEFQVRSIAKLRPVYDSLFFAFCPNDGL